MSQTSDDLSTPIGRARSDVIETNRARGTIEPQYDAARAAYLKAAQKLEELGDRYAQRVQRLEALEGTMPANVQAPKAVNLVTIEEVEAYVP